MVVRVPAAERVVARHRQRYDPSAGWGVPAHVTVLYPFVPPSVIDADVVRRLGDAVRTVAAFDCVFRRTAWFDQDVLWLAPDPDEPFRRLTLAVARAFPEHPPYGGAHAGIVPHLTVGQRTEDGSERLARVESLVSAELPLPTYVDRVDLIAGSRAPASWRTLHSLPLGTP